MAYAPVRITRPSEDIDGYTVLTVLPLTGMAKGAEFAVRRHGFRDGHLGPSGWQGAEHWFPADSSWQADDGWKLLLAPDLTRQLQEMPLELVVRGPGENDDRSFTMVWPGDPSAVPEEGLPWVTLQAGAVEPEPQPGASSKRSSAGRWFAAVSILAVLAGVALALLSRPRAPVGNTKAVPSPQSAVPSAAPEQAPLPRPVPTGLPEDPPATPAPPPAAVPAQHLETELKTSLGEKLEAELEQRMGAGAPEDRQGE